MEKDVGPCSDKTSRATVDDHGSGRTAPDLPIQGPKRLEIIEETLAGIAELPRFAFQQIRDGSPKQHLLGMPNRLYRRGTALNFRASINDHYALEANEGKWGFWALNPVV